MSIIRSVVLFLALSAICFSGYAQKAEYILVSKTGECSIQTKDGWTPVKVGAYLDESSLLRNSGYPKAILQFLNVHSGQTYRIELLSRDYAFASFMEKPDAEQQNGTAESYVRYIKETLKSSSHKDVHFVRTSSATSNRSNASISSAETELVDRIIYSLSPGTPLSIDGLRDYRSDYPVSCVVLPEGVILQNDADVDLYFILYSMKQDEDGIILTPTFADDAPCVSAHSPRYFKGSFAENELFLLLASDSPVDPAILQETLYCVEDAIPAKKDPMKIGIFFTQ